MNSKAFIMEKKCMNFNIFYQNKVIANVIFCEFLNYLLCILNLRLYNTDQHIGSH